MKPILALAQHPMYLLIKEDTGCAERTPPWGAPDIETYIERLRQNISTLRKYPQVKFGYEWSALELEMLYRDAPEIFGEMLELVKAGQCTFYNGTYSQPHLQTLSSEANFRQFEWGARVYKELCDHQVLVYAHQESSLNEQTPQLLKAFGVRYGVMPHFSSTLKMLDGGEILFHSRYGTMFMHGEEFAGWKGLDGTILDLYLEEPNHMRIRDWINFQEILGLCHVPPVMVEIPDLIDVDDQWINQRAQAEFALLDDVLETRRKIFPPRFQTRFYTNWSYIEGIRAEELSRSNFEAEVSALRAEAMTSLAYSLYRRPVDSTDEAWRKILTTQHHDVYCFCAPELRGKSIAWLREAKAETDEISTRVAEEIIAKIALPSNPQMLVVFNASPHPQTTIVTAEVPIVDPVVKDLEGVELPTQVIDRGGGDSLVRFVAHLPGLGYSTFQVEAGGELPSQETISSPFTFENDFYSATIRPDGAFTSIQLKPSGDQILAGDSIPANLLSARDSTGLGPTHEGTINIGSSERKYWEPSGRGPELHWEPSGPSSIIRTPLGASFVVDGKMGTTVKASLSVNFYYALRRIDLDWTFDFDAASIGHFFDDETKLRVQWPLAFSGSISHDIPFGVTDTRDERPFFPTHWTDISDGEKGLAYFHQGTIKHWVIGKTLFNLFAWGEHTDAIGNRLDMVRWPKCFDQRLNGRHTIHTAVVPHPGDWRSADLIGEARSFNMPPIGFSAQSHLGLLPEQHTVMSIADPEIASTSVKVVDDAIVARMYSVKEEPASVEVIVNGVQAMRLEGIRGEKLDEIGPYQIAHLVIAPTQGEVYDMNKTHQSNINFYVSLEGSDENAGSAEHPFASISRAQEAIRNIRQPDRGSITVFVQEGTYYLDAPILFEAIDSGNADGLVRYTANPGEKVTLSGGRKLDCVWEPYKAGIWRCEIPEARDGQLVFDQLFVNGKRQILARYPNADHSDPKNYSGYIKALGKIGDEIPDPLPGPDDDMTFSGAAPRGVVFDPDNFTKNRWQNPSEAVIHIYQSYYWGNLQWQIKDIEWDDQRIWFGDGGQQMGAKWSADPCNVNGNSRYYIENVFEELDSPGEWFLDKTDGFLYYFPDETIDLQTAVVEVPIIEQIVQFKGTQRNPVHHLVLEGFRFAHTESTFLKPYTIPSLSDWSIYCGGTIYMEGTRDCAIQGCFFDAVGGNAVFMRDYNRGNSVTDCAFVETGDSAICFVGSLETTVGNQRNFSYECRAENNIIHDCGAFGKQIAGVYISRAKRITVAHNEIFNMPRAGICIGDGTWGGHAIEFNHIHDTCRETGDHGPFNAWGRDRYWCLGQSHLPYIAHRSHDLEGALVDAMEPVIIRNNFFEEDSGWGLDLDDGASNYEIYNNLCVGVSMKLREGAYRTIYNNVWVNGANSPCFHVGNENNHDRYFRNITVMNAAAMKPENDLNFEMGASYGEIYTLIAPPVFTPWLEEIDHNCFYSDLGHFTARVQERADGSFEDTWRSISGRMDKKIYSLTEWQKLGFDRHSIFADPLFVDAEHGDYRVLPDSPAVKLGFINFDAREAGLNSHFSNKWIDAVP